MLRVLERDSHGGRLADLLRRFRQQETTMTQALHDMQADLEHWHREANFLRATASAGADATLARCADLQAECDLLATELVHVRMAVTGTCEELADHESRLHAAVAADQHRAAWA
jgi:hypothetical protein